MRGGLLRCCPMKDPYCGPKFFHPTLHSGCCCSGFQQPLCGPVNAAPFLSPTGSKAAIFTECKGRTLTSHTRAVADANGDANLPDCCFLLQSHCLSTFSPERTSDDSHGAGSRQASGTLPGGLQRKHRNKWEHLSPRLSPRGRLHCWPCVPSGLHEANRGWAVLQTGKPSHSH